MAPRTKVTKAVWNYYENHADKGNAVCNICNSVLKNDRTYNLKTHLLNKHEIDLHQLVSESETSSSKSEINPIARAKKEYIKVRISKQKLLKSFIGLVTEDSVPFNVLNSPNLKNIIDPICDGLGKRFRLNAKNCKSSLKKVAENIRTNMKMRMGKKLLSLKIDRVSGLSDNINVISIQFIEEDEIKSLILGMIEAKDNGASAAENLNADILKILNKYDIEPNQICSITSDNEANMRETINILTNYKTTNVVKEELDGEEEFNDTTPTNDTKILKTPANLSIEHIQMCKCAAQTAQRCLLDVAKDPEIQVFLQSCRNFTKFIHNPVNGVKEAFELSHLELPQLDCETKVGSTYAMIHSLLGVKDGLQAVESVDNKTIEENFDNNDSLWEFMDSYVTALAPLHETLNKLQSENNLHYGNFYALWLKCKMLTSKIAQRNDSKDLVKKITKNILESLAKGSPKLLVNRSLNACLFLDPRFHHTLNYEKKQAAVTYLKHLWEKLRSVSGDLEYIMPTDNPLVANEDETTFEDEAEEMLNSFLTEKLQASSGEIDMDVVTKIENLHLQFLRSDTDVLQFWRERRHSEPELYALSNICFAIPPTQLTAEQGFASLKQILTDNRNVLKREAIEDILLVKLNPIILSESINNLQLFSESLK